MTDIKAQIAEIIARNRHISLKVAKKYADKILALPIMRKCEKCGGDGIFMIFSNKDMCPTCKGEGEVPVMHKVKCPNLESGIPNNECKLCNDTGFITRPKTLKDLIEEEK